MNILNKYIIRNILNKKWRTTLIISIIAMSVALFYSSNTTVETLVSVLKGQAKAEYGCANIILQANRFSSDMEWNTISETYKLEDKHFITKTYQALGDVKKKDDGESFNSNIIGIDSEKLMKLNPVRVLRESGNFKNNGIWIDYVSAEKNGIELDDKLEIMINNEEILCNVVGLVRNEGFSSNTKKSTIYIPYDFFIDKMGNGDNPNVVYIYAKDANEKNELVKNIKENYEEYSVKEINEKDFEKQVVGISIGFKVLSLVISIIAIYIILITFKLIVVERISVITTFRSIGATKRKMTGILELECICYSLLGGILGILIGNLVTRYITYMMTPKELNKYAEYHVSIKNIVLAIIIAGIVCAIGSLSPILRANKCSLLELLVGNSVKQHKNGKLKSAIGLSLLAVAFVVPSIYIEGISLPVNVFCLILSMIAIPLIAPTILKTFVLVLQKIKVFSNETILALKNIRDNHQLRNNMVLLNICMAVIIMVYIVGNCIVDETSYSYIDSCKYDLYLDVDQINTEFHEKLNSVEGLDEVCESCSAKNVEVTNKNSSIVEIEGINLNNYSTFRNFDMTGETLKRAQNCKNSWIILSNALKRQLHAGIGDILLIKINSNECKYEVVGFIDTLINSGDYAISSSETLKKDLGNKHSKKMYIKVQDNADISIVKDRLLSNLDMFNPTVKDMQELKDDVRNNMNQVFLGLKGFVVVAIGITCIGIIGNCLLCNVYRKKEQAIYQVLGMSLKQKRRILIIESVVIGVIGSCVGMSMGALMLRIVGYILYASYQPIPIHYPIKTILIIGLLGTMFYIFISAIIALKKTKSRLVDEIVSRE